MKRVIVYGMVLFGTSTAAMAAPPTPRERVENRRDLREDRRETVNDRWDAARLEAILVEYRAAAKAKRKNVIKALDARFGAELALELRESRVEVAEKVEERNDSRRERNEERREVVVDVVKGHPVKTLRDAKDLADDQRDLRDDRRDTAAEVAALAAKRDLRDRFAPLSGKVDAGAIDRKIGIIEQAVVLAKKEVAGDVRERHEDRREIREDRKDTRRPD
jgi:hypothetical protein